MANNSKKVKNGDEGTQENLDRINKVLAYIFTKKLVTPIKDSKAYKLGLIGRDGKLKKEPKTDEEKRVLSPLDILIFKIKKLMGSRLAQLNSFMYLKASEENVKNDIVVKGGADKRAMVKRVQDDMMKMLEKYNIPEEDFYNLMLLEELVKKEFNK